MIMKNTLAILLSGLLALPVLAQDVTPPDVLVKTVTLEVIDVIAKDKDVKAGSRAKLIQLIETKVLPHFNFASLTALALGQNWHQASPEQKKRLTEEFK